MQRWLWTTQKFHKTKAHDEMTEIFQYYKLPVNAVNFVVSSNCYRIVP